MRASCWLLAGVLGFGSASLAWADEANGLTLPQLQGRVRLGMAVPSDAADPITAKLAGASVLGDYYFSRFQVREADGGGFRVTGGVFLGSRLGMWGGQPSAALGNNLFSVERYSFSLLALPRGTDGSGADNGTLPYLGLGYSSSSSKGNWGFSADLGLMAINPGNAVRLGRVLGGGQTLDEVLREVRLSPLVQLGVSYQF